jgi:hypothetical protein
MRLVFIGCLLIASCPGQTQRRSATPSSGSEHSLREFLGDYLKTLSQGEDRTTRYVDAFVDLTGNGKQQVIAYVTGRQWCGSGGCPMFILARNDSSYKVVAKTTIVRPPIRVLDVTSNGWRNIGVWVQGGGIQPGYEAELRFNGQTYPTNPSVPPARHMTGNVAGTIVVFLSDEGKPLYP